MPSARSDEIKMDLLIPCFMMMSSMVALVRCSICNGFKRFAKLVPAEGTRITEGRRDADIARDQLHHSQVQMRGERSVGHPLRPTGAVG